jgi:hypothetical protein
MTIELRESELYAMGMNSLSFNSLPVQRRRWVAAQILRLRSDPEADRIAWMIEAANPLVTDIRIIENI